MPHICVQDIALAQMQDHLPFADRRLRLTQGLLRESEILMCVG